MKNKIKELRNNKKLTLNEMSSQVSIPRATLSRYERGDCEPKLSTWMKLADYFKVPLDYLIGYKEERR